MFKNTIIHYLYYFFYKLIILEIILRKKFFYKVDLKYVGHLNGFGFGDHVSFCVNIKNKIKKNNKIFCFSQLQYEVATFFYDKKYVIKSILPIPKFLNESRLGFKFLQNDINFKPSKLTSPHGKNYKLTLNYGTQNQIKFILKNLKKFKISKKLSLVLKKKVIVIGIKNFSLENKVNKDINFQVRQTRDLNKVYKLMNYIKNKDIKIIIMGKIRDNFIKIIKSKNIIDNKKVFLFKDLSKKYSIADQVYLAEKSTGFVGNGYGAMVFFDILKKKTILFDYVWVKHNNLFHKNRLCLYKKVVNVVTKNTQRFMHTKFYSPKYYKLIENNYDEIVCVFNKIFKNLNEKI